MRILTNVTFKKETDMTTVYVLDGRGDNDGDTTAVNALSVEVDKGTSDAALMAFAVDNGRQVALEITAA